MISSRVGKRGWQKAKGQLKSLEEVNFEGEPAEGALLPLHEPLPHALVVVDVLRKARQLHNVLVPQALQ